MRAWESEGMRNTGYVKRSATHNQKQIMPAFTGICGSDLHEYLDGATIVPTSTPHPITGERAPVTMGHEFSGVVEEVGEGVVNFSPGDRVCVQPIIYDSECGACEMGQINCCFQGGFVGLSGWGGGLSDHVVVPAESVFAIPDNIPLDVGGKMAGFCVEAHPLGFS